MITNINEFKKSMAKKKVFLGGTCNNSLWRDDLIKGLEIDYFNPVVEDWTPECQAEEIKQREECDYCLYVITPKMKGVFSIAEATQDSILRPEKTVFAYITKDGKEEFDEAQIKSLDAVGNLIEKNGSTFLNNLEDVRNYLNGKPVISGLHV